MVVGRLVADEPGGEAEPWLTAAAHEVPWQAIRESILQNGRPVPTAILIERPIWRDLRVPELIEPLIKRWASLPEEETFALTDPWAALLRRLEREDRELSLWANTGSLARAFKGNGRHWGPLAAAAFAPVHQALCRRSMLEELVIELASLWGQDWDRAKHLRKELIKVARGRGWPTDVLLESAGGDRDLMQDLLHTAEKHWPAGASELRRRWSS